MLKRGAWRALPVLRRDQGGTERHNKEGLERDPPAVCDPVGTPLEVPDAESISFAAERIGFMFPEEIVVRGRKIFFVVA